MRGGRGHIGQQVSVGGTNGLINQGTILADVAGQTLTVDPTGNGATFSNQATVTAVNGATLVLGSNWTNTATITVTNSTLTLNDTWDNEGTITANDSTVNLGGAFTLAELGTFNRSGGTVNLTGTLDNSGGSLELNATTGDWTLNGGRIDNGTVRFLDGQTLRVTSNSGNRWSGVTLEGDLDLSANTATLHISNGLTFNGTITLSGSGARLSSDTTQTIDGTGTIAFAGTTGGTRHLTVEGNTTLTLGADLTVRGGHGHIGQQFSTGGANGVINQGTILADVAGQTLTVDPSGNGATFSNQATVTAVNGATLVLGSNWTNTATITVTNSTLTLNDTWDNEGTITANDSTVNLGGAFTLAELGTFNRSGGTVNLTGTLDNSGGSLELNATTGDWTLNGGRIDNGTVRFLDGQTLRVTSNSGNRWSGVTLEGDLDLSANTATLHISNGLTFNGTITLSGSVRG